MNPPGTKMSLAEFHRLPFSIIWKQEYINGRLVETPREVVVHATIGVAPRQALSPAELRPAVAADQQALLPCFRAAFAEAFEFCGYSTSRFDDAARQSLSHFFQGQFHRSLPASLVALAPPGMPEAGQPIGAALMLEEDIGWALLDMIFVVPSWQRRGLATALAAAALTGLCELGRHRTLVSRYHLGNLASRAWHHRFGFVDQPDLRLARLHLRAAAHELRRLGQLGTLSPPIEGQLVQERDRWQREVDRLEALVLEGRLEEAEPWEKWRRRAAL